MKIAIASGKGGTGKTSLAVNIAALLAEIREVVLVDMDVEEPNSGVFFDLNGSETVLREKLIPSWDNKKCIPCGICQEACNFNAIVRIMDEIIVMPQLCHSCHACSLLCPESALPMKGRPMGEVRSTKNGNIRLIENRLNVGEEQAVPLIARSLEQLDKDYTKNTVIIMDSPPGASCPVIEVALGADLVILVAEPTPFGLNDLRIAVETMKKLDRKLVVVINREGMGDQGIEKYCREESIPLLARVPYSRKAAEHYARGEMLFTEIPEIRAELQKVADFILSKTSEKTE